MKQLISHETIETKIFMIRGYKVMLDRDLAKLYGVQTKALKQAVNRNIERFPDDFMFQLNSKEFKNWRSQFVTSNSGDRMGLRYRPYAFTQEGIAMLSTVLNSERAIQVNIAIMRTFIKLREIMATHKDLARKIDDIEKKYDAQFKVVFDAIRRLLTTPEKPKKRIGFYKEE